MTDCANDRRVTHGRPGFWLAAVAGIGLVACGLGSVAMAGAPADSSSDAQARCAALRELAVPASSFALPTGGASVTEALFVPADPATHRPEYCRVRGVITAAHASDPPILYQVNLPIQWNLKTVHYGGGGLNGVLIEATGPFAGGGGPVPPALSDGYVTYGSDSGHQSPDRAFLSNPQAFANYAYEAIKRVHDLEGVVVKAYYGRAARRNYFIGGSKGGQEALQAIERYPADYDGAVAYYPAQQMESLQLGWNRLWHFAYETPGGALDTAQQALLKSAVLKACDGLDGAVDGIVANTRACARAFKVETLRCPGGQAGGETCLSDVQIAALKDGAKPFAFAQPMPNGVRSVGPWPVFLGGDLDLWFGTGVAGSQQAFYRFDAARPEALKSSGIDAATWSRDVMPASTLYDASNPDLDAFRARGGRLILVQGTTDMLVPTAMTTDYYEALAARYGDATRQFARYFVAPGYGHGRGAFTVQWDSISALDAWVEHGAPPRHPIATDGSKGGAGRTRPLCEYPAWPKYKGAGSQDQAGSFTCATR